MIKRIIYLAVPLLLLAGIGLTGVKMYFSSFPEPQNVIDTFIPAPNTSTVIDLTDTYIDDSGSMKGYYGKEYLKFLRTLKSHIRERGEYSYHAFSDPDAYLEGDVLNTIEDVHFYRQNNTYFDRVLNSISKKVKIEKNAAKNYVVITDGIQDISAKQDYSRIVDGVSDLLDAGLYLHIIAIKLPFYGRKYPEGGNAIYYKGESPLYCYIFSYQSDFGSALYNTLKALGLPAEFLGFGDRSINSSITRFSVTSLNQDGSKNAFRRFKDEYSVTYLISRSGTGGTLSTNVELQVNGLKVDSNELSKKIPEFCGKCLEVSEVKNTRKDAAIINPNVIVSQLRSKHDNDSTLNLEYSMFFKELDRNAKTLACDLTLCNWLPVIAPKWVDSWSSDCDNKRDCYRETTPYLINIITPILNRSVLKHTVGYAVIRN